VTALTALCAIEPATAGCRRRRPTWPGDYPFACGRQRNPSTIPFSTPPFAFTSASAPHCHRLAPPSSPSVAVQVAAKLRLEVLLVYHQPRTRADGYTTGESTISPLPFPLHGFTTDPLCPTSSSESDKPISTARLHRPSSTSPSTPATSCLSHRRLPLHRRAHCHRLTSTVSAPPSNHLQ
jgi:hypothetical protein